jgi:hypothetical protein
VRLLARRGRFWLYDASALRTTNPVEMTDKEAN